MLDTTEDFFVGRPATISRPYESAPRQVGSAYFIGMGGSGMRALAGVMAGRNWHVRGSDRSAAARRELQSLDWDITCDDQSISSDLVIYSDAVDADHPQRIAATQSGIPQQSYTETLGTLMSEHFRLSVAGTHGKSTVTMMAAQILNAADLAPTVVCGARPLAGTDKFQLTGGQSGGSQIFLAEACEYRQNFLQYHPHVAVVTSVELDHFETYRSALQLAQAFSQFVRQIDSRGRLLVYDDCRHVSRFRRAADCEIETYGFSHHSNWRAVDCRSNAGCYEFTIKHGNRSIGHVALQVAGRHNVLNAVAAAGLAFRGGASPDDIIRSLCAFQGLRRRLQYLGENEGVQIWDDFAHHPTAITAALATLREVYPNSRLWCVFQPHQASRTGRLLDEFARSLQNADVVAVAPVYRAREGNWQPGEPRAADLASRVRHFGTETLEGDSLGQIQQHLTCCSGDVLVTLGAGNISKISHAIANRI